MTNGVTTPFVRRSRLRRRLGRWYYCWKRRWAWWTQGTTWAEKQTPPLPVLVFEHQTPLLRRLKAVDMYLQHNKTTNLRLAAKHINGLVLQPGETFSFWKRVGKPTARKGYLEALVLEEGRVGKGIGGGLCQMGNLLYWMALHSPLSVVERWRHSYDVFPDEGRTLPFGSGATLAYNYIDLQLRNDTALPLQLNVWLSETQLHGSIRSVQALSEKYEVFETDHHFRHEPWGGYSRHNSIRRKVLDAQTGACLRDEPVTENHALMMYQPFLSGERSV